MRHSLTNPYKTEGLNELGMMKQHTIFSQQGAELQRTHRIRNINFHEWNKNEDLYGLLTEALLTYLQSVFLPLFSVPPFEVLQILGRHQL